VEPASLLAVVVLASGAPEPESRGVAAGREAHERYRRDLLDSRIHPLPHDRGFRVVRADPIRRGDLFRSRCSATVNRGTRDGVRAGSAVVRDGCYVGRVGRTTAGTSRVLLLADPGIRLDTLPIRGNEAHEISITSGAFREVPAGLRVDPEAAAEAMEGSVEIWVASRGGSGV
jgi:hypothetical protein